MVMLTWAAVPPHLDGLEGGVSGGGMGSSSKSSIGYIARGNAVAFGGFTMAFGDCIIALGGCTVTFGLGGTFSTSESLSCSAGMRVIFAGLLFSNR